MSPRGEKVDVALTLLDQRDEILFLRAELEAARVDRQNALVQANNWELQAEDEASRADKAEDELEAARAREKALLEFLGTQNQDYGKLASPEPPDRGQVVRRTAEGLPPDVVAEPPDREEQG